MDAISEKAINASLQTVFFATLRSEDQVGNSFGTERKDALHFSKVTVSIPQNHMPGRIEWRNRVPNANKEFAVVDAIRNINFSSFVNLVKSAQEEPLNETVVYIHGFNNTAPEAIFRLAQMQEDLGLRSPGVLYSWPSAGTFRGYVYDRDSVLYSRDGLVSLLDALTKNNNQIVLIAHSMGAQLAMEALRQARLIGNNRIIDRISGVVLISPDIDVDVFKRQAHVIDSLPQPFLILVTMKDRALSLSSILTGKSRLGGIQEADTVGRDDVIVYDVSDLADGTEFNHSLAVSSPTAVKIFRSLASENSVNSGAFEKFVRSQQ